MKSKPVLAVSLLAASCTWFSMGCGDEGPSLVFVSGTVMEKGKPVEGASIMFLPDVSSKDAQPAEDTTGAKGVYTPMTRNRSGIVPGKYRVVVSKAPTAAATAVANPAFADDPFMAGMASKAPTRKKEPAEDRSQFSYDRVIPAEGGTFDFDLH